jgi:hypothetical protein
MPLKEALVFMPTQPETCVDVAQGVYSPNQGLYSDIVTGPYDVITRAWGVDLTNLNAAVTAILAVPGVDATGSSVYDVESRYVGGVGGKPLGQSAYCPPSGDPINPYEAWVLITTQYNQAGAVVAAVSQIAGVFWADLISWSDHVVARVHFADWAGLLTVVMAIQGVGGLASPPTQTFVVLARYGCEDEDPQPLGHSPY